MLNIYLYTPEFIQTYYHYILLLLVKSFTMLSMVCNWCVFAFCTYSCLSYIFILSGILIRLLWLWNLTVLIIYHHMDTIWSIDLAETYFTHADYLAIKGWIYATCLYLDTTNHTRPLVYHFVKFFLGVGYMPLDALCYCIMGTVDHYNAAWSFLVRVYPALWIDLASHVHLANNMSGLLQHPCTNCMLVIPL